MCVVAVFFLKTLKSCENVNRIKKSCDEERLIRMELEEKISKLSQDKTSAEEQLKKSSQELESQKAVFESTAKELKREEENYLKLKEELEKTAKLKEQLEADLKDALVNQKQGAKTAKSKAP